MNSSFPRPKDKQMVKDHEGFRENAYLCTAGHLTVGYGFNLDSVVVKALFIGETITRERADKAFEILYNDAIITAKHFVGDVWDSLSDNHKAILADMAYNLGSKLFGFMKLRAAWQAGDLDKVRQEMINSKWFLQVKTRAKTLVEMV